MTEEHREGRPWNTVGRFDKFVQADARRKQLSEDSDLQVKVHRCGPAGIRFAVKTRLTDEAMLRDIRRKNSKKKKKKR